MDRKQTLDKALDAVNLRPKSYGPPEQNFDRIAARWNTHLRNRKEPARDLDATDVAVMMADMKLARIEETPGHEDSWIDLAGYAACGAEVSTGPAADDEGWIDWHGSKRPVSADAVVQYRQQNGAVFKSRAGDLTWPRHDDPFDIVAYRLVKDVDSCEETRTA